MNESLNQYPKRQKLPHGIPAWIRGEAILFITMGCVPRGHNQLCHALIAATIWESVEFRQSRGDWFVHLWLLMPDHLHALISFPKETNPSKVISGWKEIIAKQVGISWQRDYFDHRLRSDESHQEKAHYIRQNPVRKGLVSNADDWEFVWEST
jgi:putative transposase